MVMSGCKMGGRVLQKSAPLSSMTLFLSLPIHKLSSMAAYPPWFIKVHQQQ